MRAGRLIAAGTMACEQAEVVQPEEGQLLVRTAYASICGSDLHSVYPRNRPVRAPGRPGFPGHEGVGEVVVSEHPDFAPGDRVLTVPNFAQGMCFAEYQAVGGAYCVKLPDVDTPPEHLLMAQQLGTVIFALKRQPVDVQGKTVAIIGQGSAGAFFSFLLRRAGAARVIVTDLSEARLAYSRKLGVDVAINAEREDPVQAIRDATDGRGANFVVEAVGTNSTLAQSVEVAARRADLLWFGLPDGQSPMPFGFGAFFSKQLSASTVAGAQNEPGLASFREAVDLIVNNEIELGPLVSHVLPVEEIGRAFQIAHDRTDNALKVSIHF